MKRNWSKAMLICLIAVFTASSAMAYSLNSRSQEMTANSVCDFAGTITLSFGQEDLNIMQNHLAAQEAVVIRVSLSGTDISPTATLPILCKDIAGAKTVIGAQGGTLMTKAVAIDKIGVEVSDMYGAAAAPDGTPDITAAVKGDKGKQFFTIWITGFQMPPAAHDMSDSDKWPWIKIGLYDDLVATDATTNICADVRDFGGLSKLTVSINNDPVTLTTTTSDNQIGHFLIAPVALQDCAKNDPKCAGTERDEIALCALNTVNQTIACNSYYDCTIAKGDLPLKGEISLMVRSNGSAAKANTQSGIYLQDVTLSRVDDKNAAWGITPKSKEYYNADGTKLTAAADLLSCAFKVEYIKVTFDAAAAGIMATDTGIQVCTRYTINPEEAAVNTKVRLWMSMEAVPCGTLDTKMIESSTLVKCGGISDCMYIPYVFSGLAPWGTGVVVTNLSEVSAADMEVTFELYDSAGAKFEYTKSDFNAKVWSFMVDSVLEDWGWSPAPGNAWLKIKTNFTADGYSFLTNGAFGAGTLPREVCP